MGSIPKIIELEGTDPETAFADAQQVARHQHGHSKETGTIADADGCIVVAGPPLLPWDARRTASNSCAEATPPQADPCSCSASRTQPKHGQ